LRRILTSLGADDRAMIVLHEIDGWSVADLAALYGCPEGTIKTRLHRSRTKLRKRLEKTLSRAKTDQTAGEAAYALRRSKAKAD
jgi:RNA polymerase sigma-70 factor (ECF subfamily)